MKFQVSVKVDWKTQAGAQVRKERDLLEVQKNAAVIAVLI